MRGMREVVAILKRWVLWPVGEVVRKLWLAPGIDVFVCA
jgi:hypothetical protein